MWKKKNIDKAINYFKEALKLEPNNKTALRSLSMIIRNKENQDSQEKLNIAEESIGYAKKAISLDLQDSFSWYIMGNAYFYKAFVDKNQYKDLLYALNAYNRSEGKIKKYKNPDLFYNRAVVHSYLENYEMAYLDFKEASIIDENLKSDNLCENILNTVKTTNKLIKNMCGLKPTKLAQILTNIPHQLREDVNFKLITCQDLIEGENKEKILTGKIVTNVESSFDVPISFVCVDYSGNFYNLSIYNISKEFLSTIVYMTSSVVIFNPIMKKIKMDIKDEEKEKKIEYPCVQISDLNNLLVDGKYCSGFKSSATLSSTFFN